MDDDKIKKFAFVFPMALAALSLPLAEIVDTREGQRSLLWGGRAVDRDTLSSSDYWIAPGVPLPLQEDEAPHRAPARQLMARAVVTTTSVSSAEFHNGMPMPLVSGRS